LIFIPVKINDEDLTFMLDTGVNQTLLFGLQETEKLSLNNVAKIKFTGLGQNNSVEGLISSNNKMQIEDLTNLDQIIYVILDEDFNISSHVGIPVNGILAMIFLKIKLLKSIIKRKKL